MTNAGKRRSRIAPMVFVGAAAALSLAAQPAAAQAFKDAKSSLAGYTQTRIAPRLSCEALRQYTAQALASLQAVAIPASEGIAPHCRVTGVLLPEIAFEVSLPLRWNGRFYMFGNGGWAGESFDAPGRIANHARALRAGFATASTDTGHSAALEPDDPRAASFNELDSLPKEVCKEGTRPVSINTAITAAAAKPSTRKSTLRSAVNGSDAATIGVWPENGIFGTQLGPNRNAKPILL